MPFQHKLNHQILIPRSKNYILIFPSSTILLYYHPYLCAFQDSHSREFQANRNIFSLSVKLAHQMLHNV